jgi:hypothetical protein
VSCGSVGVSVVSTTSVVISIYCAAMNVRFAWWYPSNSSSRRHRLPAIFCAHPIVCSGHGSGRPHNLLLSPRKRNPSSAAGIARSRLLCFKPPAGRLKAACGLWPGGRAPMSHSGVATDSWWKVWGPRKSEGRLRFRKRPSYLMAVSRILFHSSLRAKKLDG